MGVNKVIYGTEILIDLSSDTVRADSLRTGYTAHGANGELIVGTLTTSAAGSTSPLEPYEIDRECEHIVENGVWKSYDGCAQVFIYKVKRQTEYMIILGCPTGTFHAMFTTTDVTQSSGEVTGTAITDQNSPMYFSTVRYRPSENGYLVIEVSRYSESWYDVYVYDAMACWGY